ncbi:DUF58 domain-containing protein [Lacihabitans sp. LS3-19]|uniref:DUF58 domain-containing protein n=1 Tax=Lacihabitans sp. LS3-19 TaxID=2487335 RepID=UPI0020CDD809|nr:DUF58 domain-containing protein [Lacihabitans sp. LS3-19]MCP9769477.1 DUF58 domain-containing protein [Lacihabitans sp. LS3-19]
MSLTKELIKVNNLQLAAKLVSDQLVMGMHASKRSGMGAEFEQYRHYIPGDDPKRIDWKLFARTQKHQIRESSTESTLCINFILDLSGSMNYSENGVSRLNYAKILLASLSYLGFRQSDHMNLYFLKDGQLERVVTEGKQSFQKILYQLENAKAAGNWTFEKVNFQDFQSKAKELLIFASDLFQTDSEFFSLIKTWERPGKEILIFQILGEREIDLNLEGIIKFKDLETNQTRELSASEIKKDYEKNFNFFLNELDNELNLKNVHIYRCKLSDPISEVLKNALKKLKWS